MRTIFFALSFIVGVSLTIQVYKWIQHSNFSHVQSVMETYQNSNSRPAVLPVSTSSTKNSIHESIVKKFDIYHLNYTRLYLAANQGQLAKLDELLQQGADINEQGASGYTALHGAVHGAQLKSVEFLIEHGADVNAQDERGLTPLIAATSVVEKSDEQKRIIEILIANGANVDAKDRIGKTVMDYAKDKANKEELLAMLHRKND